MCLSLCIIGFILCDWYANFWGEKKHVENVWRNFHVFLVFFHLKNANVWEKKEGKCSFNENITSCFESIVVIAAYRESVRTPAKAGESESQRALKH